MVEEGGCDCQFHITAGSEDINYCLHFIAVKTKAQIARKLAVFMQLNTRTHTDVIESNFTI